LFLWIASLTRLIAHVDDIITRAVIIRFLGTDASDEEFNAKMAALQQELLDRTERRENYDDVATEILRLREIQAQNNMDNATRSQHKKRIKELQKFIKTQPTAVSKFEKHLQRNFLQRLSYMKTTWNLRSNQV